MDISYALGNGHTALYKTSPQRAYYHYIAPSLQAWMEKHNEYLDKGWYQKQANILSTFLDVYSIMRH